MSTDNTPEEKKDNATVKESATSKKAREQKNAENKANYIKSQKM